MVVVPDEELLEDPFDGVLPEEELDEEAEDEFLFSSSSREMEADLEAEILAEREASSSSCFFFFSSSSFCFFSSSVRH